MNLPLLDEPPVRSDIAYNRDYVSYSSISTFQACPLRWYFRYVLALPEETVAASLVFGGAIHACVQHHFEQLLAGQPAPDLDCLLEVYQDFWQAPTCREIHYGSSEDSDSLGRLAERMLRAFQGSDFAQPTGAILGIEEELRGPVINGLPDLLARVDLLVDRGDSVELIDIKTARSRWSAAQVEEKAGQLLLYHELVKDLADGRPVRLAFAILTKTKAPEVALVPVAAEPHQLDRIHLVVAKVWQAIQSGHFYPNPSALNCPTCPYQKPCQAWTG